MDVHLRDLRAFAAVAEALHFTRAAQTLHVSQPALSRQIRALEAQLGTPLLNRDKRSVRLTAGGAALLPAVRALLTTWEQAQRDLARGAEGAIVVGMQTSPGRGLLPAIRARVEIECPCATLTLRQAGWDDASGGLADRSCDAAFVWLPLEPTADYDWVPIARERRVVALPDGHRLADAEQLAMRDLLDEPFLALPDSAPATRDFWLATDARGGHPPRIGAVVRDSEETYEAVATGLGVILLAEGNVPILDRGGVVMVPVPGLPPAQLVLAWRRDELSALGTLFVQLCAEIVAARRRPSQPTEVA